MYHYGGIFLLAHDGICQTGRRFADNAESAVSESGSDSCIVGDAY